MALNIVNVANITAKRYSASLGTSDTTMISTVATGSVAKINTLVISNVDGTNACDVTVTAGGSLIASTVSVPANASLYVITKDTSIYLEEGETLLAKASEVSDLVATVSYELLS